MKVAFKQLLLLALVINSLCKKDLGKIDSADKLGITKLTLGKNSVGSSSNSKQEPATEAVTYAYGSNGGYILKDDTQYKTPEIVQKLIKTTPIPSGDKVVADEVNNSSNLIEPYNFKLLQW